MLIYDNRLVWMCLIREEIQCSVCVNLNEANLGYEQILEYVLYPLHLLCGHQPETDSGSFPQELSNPHRRFPWWLAMKEGIHLKALQSICWILPQTKYFNRILKSAMRHDFIRLVTDLSKQKQPQFVQWIIHSTLGNSSGYKQSDYEVCTKPLVLKLWNKASSL